MPVYVCAPHNILCLVWFNIKFLYTRAITTSLFCSLPHIFLHRRISNTDLSNTLYKLDSEPELPEYSSLKSHMSSPVATVAMTELSDFLSFVCLK